MGSQTFDSTGALATFVVPAGVTSLHVVAHGAGGSGHGLGGTVEADLVVNPGETLEIRCGGHNGYNGGGTSSNAGPGAGATDIRKGGSTLANRVLVAGGGGGEGYSPFGPYAGGLGGGLVGAPGAPGSAGGGGGTQAAGGAGGDGELGSTGQPGALGEGGDGQAEPLAGVQGCGGGGGYYGGGAGGSYSDGTDIFESYGGGGGSSFGGVGTSNVVHTQGGRDGEGQVALTWIDASRPRLTRLGPSRGIRVITP